MASCEKHATTSSWHVMAECPDCRVEGGGTIDNPWAKRSAIQGLELSEVQREQLLLWLEVAEERVNPVSYYVTTALARLRAALNDESPASAEPKSDKGANRPGRGGATGE